MLKKIAMLVSAVALVLGASNSAIMGGTYNSCVSCDRDGAGWSN